MIKVLWLLGVLALTLAAVVLVLCAAGAGRTGGHERPAAGSSVIERFRQGDGDSLHSEHRLSPLVQQAQAFASYLNPPPASRPPVGGAAAAKTDARAAAPEGQSTVVRASEVKPASPSSPKFELHGISYYRSKPEQSMALVCEPGGSRRWIRQGAQFGHLTVERIDSDSVLCRDGTRTLVMSLASQETLTKFARARGETTEPKPTSKPARAAPAPPPVRGLRQMPLARVAAKLGVPLSQVPLPDDGQMESQ
jgi:hypothetical protein